MMRNGLSNIGVEINNFRVDITVTYFINGTKQGMLGENPQSRI